MRETFSDTKNACSLVDGQQDDAGHRNSIVLDTNHGASVSVNDPVRYVLYDYDQMD